ncbi:hypothetical protein HK104_009427 [Borealophlyctis nickersoniae]|nr:hypothetical protein HK104_009427 [Borealophlyctis nickersoniae]
MDSIQFVKRQGGGQVGINRFPSGGMKAIWIAAFTMFIIWLLGLILAPIANKVFSKDGKPGGMVRQLN